MMASKGTFNQGWWNCFEHFAAEVLNTSPYMDDICMTVLEGAAISKREASYWLEHSECPYARVVEVVRRYLMRTRKQKPLLNSTDLPLPVDFQWYDAIVHDGKREEYREITAHWVNRLLGEVKYDDSYLNEIVCRLHVKGLVNPHNVEQLFKSGHLVALPYETVTFRRGYTKETATYRITGIDIRYGKPEWGAKAGKKYLVISFQ